MIKIALNHFIINAGLTAFFDNVIKSFSKPNYSKWLESPQLFKASHPIGSTIIANVNISVITPNGVSYYIPRYECTVLHHLPVGVDNIFRLYVNIPDIVIGRHIAIFDPIQEIWDITFGTFEDQFTDEFKNQNPEDFY